MTSSAKDLKEFTRLEKLGPDAQKEFLLKKYGHESHIIFYTLADMHKQLSNNHFKTSIFLLLINVFSLAVAVALLFLEVVLSSMIPTVLHCILACFYGLLLFEMYSSYKSSRQHLKFSSMLSASVSLLRTKF